MKSGLMLLVDQKYSLCGYKAVFAIPYSLIKRTKMAAESSGFQIRTYYTFLQQAEKDNKPCCLKFLLGTELCICCQSSNDQWVCTDLSFFFSLQFFHMRFPFLFSFKSYSTGLFSKSKGQSVSWHVVWPQHQWHPCQNIRSVGRGEVSYHLNSCQVCCCLTATINTALIGMVKGYIFGTAGIQGCSLT